MNVTVVGIDCAVDAKKMGLALGKFDGKRTKVQEVTLGSKKSPPVEIILNWLMGDRGPVLFALDAPLGWPDSLGKSLAPHQAGGALPPDSHSLFRRKTDLFIRSILEKQSLDVGADRIARTAHAALLLLGDLRGKLSKKIPLAWETSNFDYAAIEVYPAATLKAHGINASGYKNERTGGNDRDRVLAEVKNKIDVETSEALDVSKGSDALDAVICLLAAQDFLTGNASGPDSNLEALARKEGWIWARKR